MPSPVDVQRALSRPPDGEDFASVLDAATPAASAVSFSPTGTVAATDVQAAIAEVASEAPASGLTVISRQVLGAPAASVTFSSIPGTYENLILGYTTKLSGTGANWEELRVQFNGDTGNNYGWLHHRGQGASGGLVARSTAGVAFIVTGFVVDSAATVLANTASTGRIEIPGYARTVFNKTLMSLFSARYSLGESGQAGNGGGLWASTAAITSITLLPAAGNFVTGSVFTLYGLAGA